MRRIDDCGEVLDTHHAHVGNRRRSALILFRLQLAVLGALAEILHLIRNRRQCLCLGHADNRCDQPAGDRYGHADIGMPVFHHCLVGPGNIRIRDIAQGERQRLDDHVVDRQLVGWLSILFRCGGVQLCPKRHQRIEFAIDSDIEMRDRLLRFLQPLGNGLAHAVMLDEFVGPFGKVLQDRIARHAGWHRSGSRCCGGLCFRCGLAGAGGNRSLDIALDDTAMWTGTADGCEVEPRFPGEAARQRRRERTIATR